MTRKEKERRIKLLSNVNVRFCAICNNDYEKYDEFGIKLTLTLEECVSLFRGLMESYKTYEDYPELQDEYEHDYCDVKKRVVILNKYLKNNYGVVFSMNVEDWEFDE